MLSECCLAKTLKHLELKAKWFCLKVPRQHLSDPTLGNQKEPQELELHSLHSMRSRAQRH